MATNLIYKGELNGTQVDFRTGSLTDISTFTGDVRGTAIQNSIANGVTDIGASQNAIYDMSGVLAALTNHVDITPGSDIEVTTNASGSVLNNITVDLDADGHVVATAVSSINLDTIYYPRTEVNVLTGILNGRIATNDTELATLRTATGVLNTNITGNDAELVTLRTATGYLENQIDDLQAVSGVPTFDAVTDVNAVTSNDITVGDIRVGGGSITGPATITIDPDAAGASGKVIIAGDLQVDGTTTTINSTSVQIDDLSLVLGTGAPNAASADGGGIIIDGTGAANIAEFTFDGTNNRWKTNSIDIAADIVGNASTASSWVADSRIELGGDLQGHVDFNADMTGTLTATIANGAVENDMLAGSIANSKFVNSSVSYGGVALSLGGSDATPAFDLSDATNYPTTALVGTITNTQLAGSIANSKLSNSSITITAGSGIAGGGAVALGNTTSLGTSSDQGHLDEIELGSDNSAETNLVTKGGIIILRGTGAYGITTSGAANGNAMDLNDKTTVAFEGVVQSVRTDQDSDNGNHVSMWKIQGAIRRDSDSTNMLQSFVTNTFQGSNAAASSSELSVSVNGNGLKINNVWSQTNLVTSATINYNWIEDAS